MNLDEYSEKAIHTAIYPNKGNNIVYPVLGLIGETGEVVDKLMQAMTDNEGLIKEIGDVFWYINAICYELQVEFKTVIKGDNITPTQLNILELLRTNTEIAEKTKKILRDNNGVITQEYIIFMVSQLKCISQPLISSGLLINTGLEEILEKNIEKLFSRQERNQLKGSGDNR